MTRTQDIYLYAALFTGAVVCFCLSRTGLVFGNVRDLLAIAGGVTCGWSWLLTRALFRLPSAPRAVWPLMTVCALVAADAYLQLGGNGALPRMTDNLSGLVSSAMLLLAATEPLRGLHKGMGRAERRFRFIFAGGYVTILAVAVIWINGAPADSLTAHWGSGIKMACALLALFGMLVAAGYRIGHPMPEAVSRRRSPIAGQASGHEDLGAHILRLMETDAVYAAPDLKVADLARRANALEYKVTQCITGTLGFRNFNHMINHFRVAQARSMLADPACDRLPVLTIALDCGFGSIGPFNRAFKAEVGMTPTRFREIGRYDGDSNGAAFVRS